MDYRRRFAAFASRPDAQWRLFAVSALEAMFIPLPSDFLLIPMALLAPDRAFRYAFVASAGSVVGALIGFMVGFAAYQALQPFAPAWVETFMAIYRMYSGIFLISAGFSSVPFNVVTLLSGMAGVNLLVFAGVMVVVRTLRYTLISWLIWRGGARYQEWLERNFYGTMLVMTLALLVLCVIGVLFFETA